MSSEMLQSKDAFKYNEIIIFKKTIKSGSGGHDIISLEGSESVEIE